METEGVGILPPAEVRIEIEPKYQELFRSISNDRNSRHGYANSINGWRKGMTADPVYKGICGEYATVAYLAKHGLNVEWSPGFKKFGDGGYDILYRTVKIDVKTGVPWIRRLSSKRELLELSCDIFVFARLVDDGKCVFLRGFIFAVNLLCGFGKVAFFGHKRPQGHRNLECNTIYLEPMSRLVTILKAHG